MSLDSFVRLVSVTEMQYVSCDVWTELLCFYVDEIYGSEGNSANKNFLSQLMWLMFWSTWELKLLLVGDVLQSLLKMHGAKEL
jgi:hypothetical protein